MNFGLDDADWKLIQEMIINPLSSAGAKIWIFGSRARGDFKKFSDLDVLYMSSKKLDPSLIASIRENLEESQLPIKIDLVSEADLADSYRDQILSERVVVE